MLALVMEDPRPLVPEKTPPVGCQWRVVVPYRCRKTGSLRKLAYPNRHLPELVYTLEDACAVLGIFTSRWRDTGNRPPVHLEPYAEAVRAGTGAAPPRYRFTAYEVQPWVLVERRYAGPPVRVPTMALSEDEESEEPEERDV